MALVLDTGVLWAALYADDPDHDRCATLIADTTEQLIVPAPVFVELDYWVRKYASADAWLTFCEDVAGGAYAIGPLDERLLLRAAQLEAKYSDLPLDLTDAVVFSTCEELGESKIGTLDHRDFGVLRTSDGAALTLLPDKGSVGPQR